MRSATTKRTTTVWPCFSFHVLLRLVVISLLCTDANAFVRRPNKGLMKLCPPGGQSFAAAWEITCGMRRRKRGTLTPPVIRTEDNKNGGGEEQRQQPMIMTNTNGERATNNKGETDMAQQLLSNATAVASTARMPKTWWHSIGEMFFGSPNFAEGDDPLGSLANNHDDQHLYRPPSMTEMMQFCCRFGCSLRDLMPYCDPFGEWDS